MVIAEHYRNIAATKIRQNITDLLRKLIVNLVQKKRINRSRK
jgi:hypothetical protein